MPVTRRIPLAVGPSREVALGLSLTVGCIYTCRVEEKIPQVKDTI